MKNFLLTVIFCSISLTILNAQNVVLTNGDIVFRVEQYGALRYSTISGLDTSVQIDRASVLVGGLENQVFDYINDAENIEAATIIESPLLSDYEASVALDNSYSGLPPAVGVKINVYLWNDGNYVICKFTVTNNEVTAATLTSGMEILPQISNEYGFEKVDLSERSSDFTIYKDAADYIGVKLLNSPLASLKTIEWFDGYNGTDANLWSWLAYNAYDSSYASGADGVVSFISQAAKEIGAGESLEMFVAFASGKTDDIVEANMKLAINKYGNFATSVTENNNAPTKFSLSQNYPNPFNPSTSIEYSVINNEFVTLKIYDVIGNEIAVLVNEQKKSGTYEAKFNAANLSSGIYFYTLTAGNFVQTKKMMLLK